MPISLHEAIKELFGIDKEITAMDFLKIWTKTSEKMQTNIEIRENFSEQEIKEKISNIFYLSDEERKN